jgi:hypothetical protein
MRSHVASIGVIGFSGWRIVPAASQVRMMRVVLWLPAPSDGPTGPAETLAFFKFPCITANCIIIDHSSAFEPGLVAPFLYTA